MNEIFQIRNVNYNLRKQTDFATVHANTKTYDNNLFPFFLLVKSSKYYLKYKIYSKSTYKFKSKTISAVDVKPISMALNLGK